MISKEQIENKALIEAKIAELKELNPDKPEGWLMSVAVRELTSKNKLKKSVTLGK